MVNRKAARSAGRTASQRNAIVIDRFFESKEAALAWGDRHPHFMTVRVVPPGSREESNESKPEISKNEIPVAAMPEMRNSQPQVDANGMALSRPIDAFTRTARRTTL